MNRRHIHALQVLGLLLLTSAPLLMVAALDTRAPNDHDLYYTHGIPVRVIQLRHAEGVGAHVDSVAAALIRDPSVHPPLARFALTATLWVLGASPTLFRGANLPFLITIVLGIYLAGRELRGHRFGLMAGFVVGTLPIVLNYSRKWDLVFHAVGPSMITIWLALRIVAGRPRPRLAWLGIATAGAVAVHCHPVALGFVLAVFGALAAVQLATPGVPLPWRIRRTLPQLVAAGVLFLALDAYFLGLLEVGPLTEPPWSFGNYLADKSHDFGFAGGAAGGALAGIVRMLRDLLQFHLMPGWLLLLVLPGLVAVPLAMLREPRDARDHWLRPAMVLLTLVLLAHGPVVVRTMAHGCNTKDWMGLLPVLALLFLLALSLVIGERKGLPPRLRTMAPWLLVANGLLLAWVPLAVSSVGTDPLVDRERYRRWPLHAFTACETGYRINTYHLLSRTPHASRAVLERLDEVAGPPRDDAALELAFHDLRLMPDRSGPDGLPLWRWATPDDLPHPLPDSWPAFRAGWAGLRAAPAGGQASTRFHLFRLRTDQPELLEPGGPQYSHRSQLTPQALEGARAAIEDRFGNIEGEVEVLEDPGHWLLFQLLERDSDYLGTSLLVDRGSGAVLVAP